MNVPIAIIDSRAPKKAIQNLSKEFEVFEFKSKDITYDAVSGHPDIFIFQSNNSLILAPNSPSDLVSFLESKSIQFTYGEKAIGTQLENSTQFNCITQNNTLFHKDGVTDATVVNTHKNHNFINIPQAYTRCSMFVLPNGSCITSDKGICKILEINKIKHFYINPEGIMLPPYKHGFLGGCVGLYKSTLYIIGSLGYIDDGYKLMEFIQEQNIQIHELYKGQLYDGGGIFFV